MEKQQEIVKVSIPKALGETNQSVPSRALHIKVDQQKSVTVYNHVNNYILSAVLEAVFPDAH